MHETQVSIKCSRGCWTLLWGRGVRCYCRLAWVKLISCHGVMHLNLLCAQRARVFYTPEKPNLTILGNWSASSREILRTVRATYSIPTEWRLNFPAIKRERCTRGIPLAQLESPNTSEHTQYFVSHALLLLLAPHKKRSRTAGWLSTTWILHPRVNQNMEFVWIAIFTLYNFTLD